MASADILRAAHASLPYAACEGEENVIVNIVDGKANHYVATCHAHAAPDVHGDKTAAFIVRACNAHYQMLEALKTAQAALAMLTSPAVIGTSSVLHAWAHCVEAEAKARAAIAAAEAEAGR